MNIFLFFLSDIHLLFNLYADNTCSELTVGSHVKYSPMKVSYKSGAIVTVSCWPGYKLNRLPSGNTVKCVNGSWNPSVTPNCSSK